MRSLVAIILLTAASGQSARGELVLSEILANEPADRVLLEWLEIFNNGPDIIEMADYLLVENEDTLALPSAAIASGSYAVFCRRLEPLDGSDCFEYRWGDSTGIWGDAPSETYAAFEIGISLANSGGSVYLMTSNRQIVDYFNWDESADDGRSLERTDVADIGSPWHACYDPAGSTPGQFNSNSPSNDQNYFLQIDPRVISRSEGARSMLISYAAPPGSEVSISVFDDTALKRADLASETGTPVGQLTWHLIDNAGKLLTPGLYLIVIKMEGATIISKSVPVVISP